MVDAFNKLLDTELEKISKMPALNDAVLNNLHKLTDTKKNLLKIDKLEMETSNGMMDGYSNRRMGGSYDMGYSGYSMTGPIYRGGSYDQGYSRTDVHSHLEAAMRDARSEQEREEIRQLMMRYPN
jgi:hypothetical protein